jgi:hypothetical protein
MGEEAYNSHVRDPFLKFPNPVGNGRIGDDNQERVDFVLLRSEVTDQGCDLDSALQLTHQVAVQGAHVLPRPISSARIHDSRLKYLVNNHWKPFIWNGIRVWFRQLDLARGEGSSPLRRYTSVVYLVVL